MTLDERLEEIMTEYRFLQILTTPWKQQPAYKLGIINERGKILKQRSELTEAHERQAYPDAFYAYCWNIKRLVEQVFTNTLDANTLIKTVCVLKEQYGGLNPDKYETHILNYLSEKGISKEQFGGMLILESAKFETNATKIQEVFGISLYQDSKNFLFTLRELKKMSEDGAAGTAAPANNVSGGQIAGVSPGQEPPMPKNTNSAKKRKKLQRRQQERIKQDIQTINIIKPNS